MKTFLPKNDPATRRWQIVDAEGQVLGRLATQVADMLRGKNTPTFTPHWDLGAFVIVINAEKILVTGKKETEKHYMTYSGWRGGQKYRTVAEVRKSHPELLITRAVKGMVPKNRLGRQIMTKLRVFSGKEHPHASQQPAETKITN
ncbi:MAG: 50S ribosomal protein L13 [Pedosphaera sp.]|nr:50S ribosomal protein L13 [Pedosphaera sp.]